MKSNIFSHLKRKSTKLLLLAGTGLCLASLLSFNIFKTHKSLVKEDYAADQLFRGIMFAQGDVALQIPELRNVIKLRKNMLTPAEQKAFSLFSDQVITNLENKHAEFLQEFKKIVQSGNPVLIQNELNKSTDILFDVIADVTDGQITKRGIAKLDFIINQKPIKFNTLLTEIRGNKISRIQFKSQLKSLFGKEGESNSNVPELGPQSVVALYVNTASDMVCLIDCCQVVTSGAAPSAINSIYKLNKIRGEELIASIADRLCYD